MMSAAAADGWRRDVHGRQIPRPQQPRQRDSIAPVGLYFVAGLPRDERRRDHLAGEALVGEVAVQVIATRAGFVGEDQRRRLGLQSPNQLVKVGVARAYRAEKHRRRGAVALGMRDGDRVLVHVQTNKKRCRLCHG